MNGILVLTRTLGDVVLANVLIKNIKLQYPSIKLDYVVEEVYVPLVADNPMVNKVIPIKSTIQDWDKVLAIISSSHYEKVFFAQQTNGYDNSWHQRQENQSKHLVDFYAERCGIKLIERNLLAYVISKVTKPAEKIIAMHNKTLAHVKDWGGFNELSKMLIAEGYKVAQLGKGDEPNIEGAERLKFSLREIMEFFAQKGCNLFIGLDSGLSYLAAAFNVPVVSIYGATIPTTNGAYGPNVHSIIAEQHEKCKTERNNIRCHGILNGYCLVKSRCIDKITATMVFDKVMEVLRNGKASS